MNTIKHFFEKVWLLMTDRSVYKKYEKSRLGEGMKYLYALLWCTSLISTISIGVFWAQHHQKIEASIANVSVNLATAYPEELVVTISGGMLYTNVKEPYIVDPFFAKTMLKTSEERMNSPSHFLTIDTKASIDDYASYDSLIFVTQKAVVAPDKENSLRIFLLKNIEKPIIINKALYQEIYTKIAPVLAITPGVLNIAVIALVILGPFIGAAFGVLGYMLYLLFATLILWAISGILKRRLTYGQIYQMSLYGLTSSIVITTITWAVLSSTPEYFFSLIFFVWMTSVIVSMKPKKK